jgi:hypothetical protein
MRSCIANWSNQPFDAVSKLSSSFKVIAMDQRCGGQLDGPLPSGWHTFRDDQLAVLDDAGVESGCLLCGSCIGPSFIFSLLLHAPSRFNAAVLMQPIGLAKHTTEPGQPWQGLNTFASQHWFGDWAAEMQRTGRAERPNLQTLYHEMFVSSPQFVFSASRDDVASVTHPLLVLAGKDCFHPTDVAQEIAKAAPAATYVPTWRDEHYVRARDSNLAPQPGQSCAIEESTCASHSRSRPRSTKRSSTFCAGTAERELPRRQNAILRALFSASDHTTLS